MKTNPRRTMTGVLLVVVASLVVPGCGGNSNSTASSTTSTGSTSTTSTIAPTASAADLRDTISAALNTGNFAALEPLMAPSVDYAIAATESFGTITAAAAVNEVATYFNDAKAPWNFAMPADVLNTYKTGTYKTYVADDTYFGVSTNNNFISFRVKAAGEIDQVFMCANTDLLE